MITKRMEDEIRLDEYNNFRAYYFCNMYLSGIQKGIQALHVTTEMYDYYRFFKNDRTDWIEMGINILNTWAQVDKTVILLDAGNSRELQLLYDAISPIATELGFPFHKFNEDYDSLNGALTCVGIVLPDVVWGYDPGVLPMFNPFELGVTGSPDTKYDGKYRFIKGLLDRYELAR